MAIVHITLDLSHLSQEGGIIDNEIQRRALLVESRSKVLCPRDKGNLVGTISSDRADRPLAWQVSANAEYAMWIHSGKRFDPRGKEGGRIIYVRRGPRPFLVDALDAAR